MINNELERKFLVHNDFKNYVTHSYKIVQGYISSVPERAVRVRLKGDKGFITIKGIGNETGISRFEWEKEIPVEEVNALLELCEPGTIDKIRHIVPVDKELFFEIDEFLNQNSGLYIAEIELPSEDTVFHKPNWLRKEVTGDVKYYNSYLVKNPFNNW